jgi:hypothetical protein
MAEKAIDAMIENIEPKIEQVREATAAEHNLTAPQAVSGQGD